MPEERISRAQVIAVLVVLVVSLVMFQAIIIKLCESGDETLTALNDSYTNCNSCINKSGGSCDYHNQTCLKQYNCSIECKNPLSEVHT